MPSSYVTLLWDALDAARAIQTFTVDADYDRYEADLMLRSAVERQFEVLGEALNRLRRKFPDRASQIDLLSDIIDFRNVIAHGYDILNNKEVWQIIQNDLPDLLATLQHVIDSEGTHD